jgi:broad specificity phosphatase PhoE
MAPTKIMVIRHGEKEKDFPGDPNIDRNGKPDDSSLNTQGWRRAQALVGFFVDADAPGVAKPNWLFAAAPSADSKRPMETVTLLAEALWENAAERGRRFNSEIGVDNLQGLVNVVMQADGVCLVCWEHHHIPGIAQLIPHVPVSPSHWPGHRFDMVWIFDPHPNAWAFSQTPENLLPGDKDRPIKDTDG